MVNPKSDLFEQHPDWVIAQPKRELELQRNQLVLDLTRPDVQEFEWQTIRNILDVPDIILRKWDCNRFLTQPGSSYLARRPSISICGSIMSTRSTRSWIKRPKHFPTRN